MPDFEKSRLAESISDLTEADGILKSLARLSGANSTALELAAGFLENRNGRARPAREQSKHLEARYQTLVEQIPAVIFMASLEGGMGEAYVSPYIESVLGFSQEDWLRDPVRWYRQIHPEDRERWSLEAAELVGSGAPLRSTYRVLSRSGRVIWFQCEAKLVRDEDGRPWFIHGIAIDITELKETHTELQKANELVERRAQELESANLQLRIQMAEREQAEKELRESEARLQREVTERLRYAANLEKALEVKAEFLSVMSHELRTPLNIIKGYGQAMSDNMFGPINQDQSQALATIERNANDLARIVNDIMIATRLQTDKLEVEWEEVSPIELLAGLKEVYDTLATDNIALKWRYSEDLPNFISDGAKLKHLLENLIHNAIKFTPSGTVTVIAHCLKNRDGPETLQFSVADTGVGISDETLPEIFEMFRQGDSSSSRAYEGAGLGLYIAKKFSEGLGGSIVVESTVDKGSVFTVNLPLKDIHHQKR